MATTTRTKRKASMSTKRPPRKLSRAELLKIAKKNPPPQSWFDETDVPFVPTKD
jgi:hypothetical protein